MFRALAAGLLISSLFLLASAADNEYPRCNCEDEGFWSVESILECQRLMQGNIWVVPNPQGFPQSMALILRFQLRSSIGITISELGETSSDNASNSTFNGLQVLLADDDDINRAVTKKLLEKLGCCVTAVSSGFECLSALGPSSSLYQIVLLELHMRELDGFEVATRVCKLRSRSRSWPLIIALTATDDDEYWERFKQVGITGIIRKPLLLQEIIDEIRRVLVQANKAIL